MLDLSRAGSPGKAYARLRQSARCGPLDPAEDSDRRHRCGFERQSSLRPFLLAARKHRDIAVAEDLQPVRQHVRVLTGGICAVGHDFGAQVRQPRAQRVVADRVRHVDRAGECSATKSAFAERIDRGWAPVRLRGGTEVARASIGSTWHFLSARVANPGTGRVQPNVGYASLRHNSQIVHTRLCIYAEPGLGRSASFPNGRQRGLARGLPRALSRSTTRRCCGD